MLAEDRVFDPDPAQRQIARELYAEAARWPLLCPHGHVDPRVFADPDYSFGNPAELFVIPDHYLVRMLYSQGVPLEQLGVARRDGGPVEADPRRVWQTFAEHFPLFRGTPSALWITHALQAVFGVQTKLTGASAAAIYDAVAARLAEPAFRPRALYERFNIAALCTTDGAADALAEHQALRASGWPGVIRPTFRPDTLINLQTPNWSAELDRLSAASGRSIHAYPDFIQALEQRRGFFKMMGATATDHGVITPFTQLLEPAEAQAIFQRALHGQATEQDAQRFTAHMLMEMARMSVEDGLVMQLHPGALRDHNALVAREFGPNLGGDIPVQGEYTRSLRPLLNRYGNDPRFTLIVFTLDETTYARELAPLAGHYPAVKLGPPWWFHDSLNGMRRYFDQVMETAGLYNTVGFNDDTRAFCSIPARHDLWRRASANWLAGLVVRGLVDEADARVMAGDLAYGLARAAYRL